MPLAAVILDLGNVLAFHDNALLFRKLGERAGLSGGEVGRRLLHDPLWEAANRGHAGAEAIRAGVGRALGVDFDEADFTERWCCHFTMNEPMFPWVERLAGRVRLLVLSNTNLLHRDYLLPRMPVLRRFDHLLFSCDLGLVKPEPAIFHEALSRAGVAPGEAAFFDDLKSYVDAAEALGIHGRLFRSADEFPAQLASLGLEI